jgi:uncharacterized delta-60 repeat protein
MRSLRIFAVTVLITAFTALSVLAVNQLDLTFNAVPSKAAAEDPQDKGQVVQPDGKIIVWGGPVAADGLAKGQVARLNADGTVDPTFTYCGCHFITLVNVQVQPDGKILVGGKNPVSQAKVVRLNSDGSTDNSFNSAIPVTGGTTADARVWEIQSDGKIFIEKTEIPIQFAVIHKIYRLNADGSLDGGFTPITLPAGGSSTVTWITDFLILPDGRFMYTTITNGPSGQSATLRRKNSNGTADATWEEPTFAATIGIGSIVRAHGLDLQADGAVIVGGKFTTVNGVNKPNVVRVLPAGNVDLTFTGPASFLSAGMPRVLQNGQIVITAVTDASNLSKFYRLNSDGSLDASLAGARDSGASKLGALMNTGFAPPNSITNVQNRYTLDSMERILFFGTSDQPSQRYFRLNSDGSEDSSFGPNTGDFGDVYALARQADGKVIIAGEFAQMNAVSRVRIARVNVDGTLDPTFDPGTGFNIKPDAMLIQPDGKIIAIGGFTTYNNILRPRIARINADGSLDTSYTPTLSSEARGMVLQPDGKLVLVGSMSTVNGTARTGVARLNSDGSLDMAFNPVVGSPSINSVTLQADGKITIAGSFNGVNGFSRVNMVRLNSDGSLDQTLNIGSSFGIIRSAWQQPDGKYLTVTNDGSEATLSRRNTDGSADGTFTLAKFRYDPSSTDTRINTLTFQSNGKILVGGNFFTINSSVNRYYFVRLNANGSLDTSYVQNDPNGEVRTAVGQPDGKVIIGGDFYAVESVPRAGVARIITGEASRAAFCDFDGDGRADIGVFRPSDGNWYLAQSQNGFAVQHFGLSGDRVAAADYDGDGKTDVAIFRNGDWWYLGSGSGTVSLKIWGAAGDVALPSDVDADGKADFVYYRPSTGEWFRNGSTAGAVATVQFGMAGDIPLMADMDGDGKADPAIFRPSNGVWWYKSSVTGIATSLQWGQNGDVPVPGDYDGDGKTDAAVWRPSNGAWYIFNSGSGTVTIFSWGLSGDRPVAADYDGDGKADIAIYRPSSGVWYIMQSTSGFTGLQYGLSTDTAVPNAFLP